MGNAQVLKILSIGTTIYLPIALVGICILNGHKKEVSKNNELRKKAKEMGVL